MDEFLKVSQALTGNSNLDPELAKAYRAVVEKAFGANLLYELLHASHCAGDGPGALEKLNKIMEADTTQRVQFMAKQIVKLWLFSQYNDPEQTGRLANAGYYGRSLFWETVKAFPPSLSPGPHGYWTQKPA
jgi:Membrane bound FAD containing D-sorbitol dehydrogenase